VRGYPLTGLKGRHRLGLVWTPKPWTNAKPPPALLEFLSSPEREGRLQFADPDFGRMFLEITTIWVEEPSK